MEETEGWMTPISPIAHDLIMSLGKPYASALLAATNFIGSRFRPMGILAGGTIFRGEHHASSDLDIVVIHDLPWRQRI